MSRVARARSWRVSAATTPVRRGCPTARSSTCPMPTAGSRSCAARRTGATGSCSPTGSGSAASPRAGPATSRCHPRTASRLVHIEVHDGLIDLVVRGAGDGAPPKRGRGRPPKAPRTVAAATKAERISPWDGVWRAVGWLPDGAWIAAVGESETRPQDLWLLPVPGVAPDGARPRQVTDSRPAVLARSARPGPRAGRRTDRHHGPRRAARGRDPVASGHRDRQTRRQAGPHDHLPARRADLAVVPLLPALQAAARAGGLRVPRRRLPRLHGLRTVVPPRQLRRVGPRRRPRPHRCGPLGAGAAVVGRAAGDLRRVVRRLHGPVRARRGAGAVRGRRGPVRRLRDRRELPARRPTRAPGPAQADGHARRSGADRALPPRLSRSTAPSASRRPC